MITTTIKSIQHALVACPPTSLYSHNAQVLLMCLTPWLTLWERRGRGFTKEFPFLWRLHSWYTLIANTSKDTYTECILTLYVFICPLIYRDNVSIHTCIHIHLHIHIHTYTHTNTHTYTHAHKCAHRHRHRHRPFFVTFISAYTHVHVAYWSIHYLSYTHTYVELHFLLLTQTSFRLGQLQWFFVTFVWSLR